MFVLHSAEVLFSVSIIGADFGHAVLVCLYHKVVLRVHKVFLLFNADTNQRICFLNVTPDEVIRSLFYNKNNDSLITVSVYASDNFSSLKCRSTRIEYVNPLCMRCSHLHSILNSLPHPKICVYEQEESQASKFSGSILFNLVCFLLIILAIHVV